MADVMPFIIGAFIIGAFIIGAFIIDVFADEHYQINEHF
jgi:hypothetical protein